MKETKLVVINARDEKEEDDPIPVHGKTIREQIIKGGEKDIGERNIRVTTVHIEFKLKKTRKRSTQ
eukprot:7528851-Ditylum_brightwellii.AAC.1